MCVNLNLQMQGVSKEELKQLMSVFVTYDPMNLGVPVDYQVKGSAKEMQVTFHLNTVLTFDWHLKR